MTKAYGQKCPIARTLEVIGERWTLLIIRDLFGGPQRFQDLQESLSGAAPNLLSDRLKTLEEHGLVRREFYSEHPPRAAYALTPRGRELAPALRSLATWGAKHFGGPVRVIHEACRNPIELHAYCPHCAVDVPSEDVMVTRPGRREPRQAAAAGLRRRPR